MNTPYFDKSDLLTKVRMILVYYWTEGCNYGDKYYGGVQEDKDDQQWLFRAIKRSRQFVEGRTKRFDDQDWWLFADALGCVDLDKYPDVAELYELANKKFYESAKKEQEDI